MAEEFTVWLEEALKEYAFHRENKICVVTIAGKTPLNELWTKGGLLNEFIGKRVFADLPFLKSSKSNSCKIEVYFDPDNQCVFMNLISHYDLNIFEYECSPDNYYDWWVQQEQEFTANLLFLFTVSQTILFVHPTCRFDLSYIRILRNLNHLREKTISNVCDILSDVSGVSKGWASVGRCACPRVLFLFHRPPSFMKPDGTVETKRGSYRKLAVCLEDQIYKLFRRSRVVTNNTANSVCSLPLKQSFCYIFAPGEEPKDVAQELLNNLARISNSNGKAPEDPKRPEFDGVGFREFLYDHVDLAHTDGFDDNIGKVGPPHFELPKFKAFVRSAALIYDFYVANRSECPELTEINNLVDIVTKFSEGRCNKVYPIALGNYQDGLPSFYSEITHRTKLLQSMQVLQQQARGPALEKAKRKLADECEAYWRNGRQACETFSLTGNICLSRRHRTSSKEDETDLPVMWHNSKVKFLGTCNCGRRQTWREDPFDVYEANYSFYEENPDFGCCRRLDRYEFPVYRRKLRKQQQQAAQEDIVGAAVAESDAATSSTQALPVVEGRKISVEQLFDNLRIETATQEELNVRNPVGDDFLPDRDNRPASKGGTMSQQNSGESEPMADATGGARAASRQSRRVNKEASRDPNAVADDLLTSTNTAAGRIRVKTQDDDFHVEQDMRSCGTGSEISELLRNEILSNELDEPPPSVMHRDNSGDHRRHRTTAEPSDETGRVTPSVDGPQNQNDVEGDDQERLESEEDDQEELGLANSEQESEAAENEGAGDGESGADYHSGRESMVQSRNDDYNEEEENRGRADWPKREDEDAEYDEETYRSYNDEDYDEDESDKGMYITGMTHNQSPSGLLPLFPSWTLICVGHSSIYSHSGGLRDPNFSHGSQYLLPWDVPLIVDLERWHDLMEIMMANTSKRVGAYKKPRMPVNKSDKNGRVTVKVFVGYEYECLRGHRFILQAPDKMVKYAGPGGPKDSGSPVVNNDMPIWFPCGCRQIPPLSYAQLMRVHIVTPKAPVLVTVSPRVQPHLNIPVIFHPGAPAPAKLGPAQYWILRLPFAYVGPGGPLYPPKDSTGRIFKGMIGVLPDL